MIDITFKDVGQGDSIIIEWTPHSSNNKKIAIIDCKKQDGNPVLKHLIDNNYQSIEYIILSHPHFDHCSGFKELFEYCINKNVEIKYFIHTCDSVPDFIKTANKTKKAKKEVQELFLLLRELPRKTNTKYGAMSSDLPYCSSLPLDDVGEIKMLSPSSHELDNYRRKVDFGVNEEEVDNDTDANWLSTIFQILLPNNTYVLLVSDCSKTSLTRIGKEKFDKNQKLILGQSPHHGAKGNHTATFWRMRKYDKMTPMVFSVGKNGYKHPSEKAIDDFKKYNYSLYSTNQIGGLINIPDSVIRKSSYLSLYSKSIKTNFKQDRYNGDKKFRVSSKGVEVVK